MIRVVSFDLDGTLIKTSFADSYWLEGLPRVYANEKGVSLEKAKAILFKDYEAIGKERIEWYEPAYWFNRYNLKYSWRKLMEDYKSTIEPYPDALSTLERLKEKYRLVILSNAERIFVEIELEKTNFSHYFSEIFSSVTDFGMVKKNAEVYRKVCSTLGIEENEMVHVGDDRLFDYEIPKSVGINALHLNRNADSEENHIINSLNSLPDIISRF